MTSTLNSWMNADGTPSGTPNVAQPRGRQSPSKSTVDQTSGCKLALKAVMGTTTSTPAAFAYLPKASCFAACAGSMAVVNHVDQDLNVQQSFFRATSNMHAGQGSSGYDSPLTASTPDARNRQLPSLKANVQTPKSLGIGSEFSCSLGKGPARQRTRSATCISLSPDGQYLAMGEVGTWETTYASPS